jgi:hypothetical protein
MTTVSDRKSAMSGDGATLSAFIAVLVLTTTAVFSGGVLISRTRTVAALSRRQGQRGREHELHWAAIRLRSNGHQGSDLQEMLCALTNCSPTDADRAIIRVGADV